MKFHSLMAVSLLLLSNLPAALPQPDAAAHVYQNGDLVLEIRDTAGGEIVRAGLDYFFHDEHIATANELPAAPVAPIGMQGAVEDIPAAGVASQLPEPFSLGLLGAGLVLLGWTRRQGTWFERLKEYKLFPWPGLSWLD
jgi:hypothetical protein